jgi:hypothetical protein
MRLPGGKNEEERKKGKKKGKEKKRKKENIGKKKINYLFFRNYFL